LILLNRKINVENFQGVRLAFAIQPFFVSFLNDLASINGSNRAVALVTLG